MNKLILTTLATLLFALPASASVEIGKLAPNFTGTALDGEVSLEQFRGKNVVLEWTNPECPFVVKHYSKGHMQALQKEVTEGGDIWLSINSGGEGKQGHMDAQQATQVVKDKNIAASHYILDESGLIGKLYGAKTTPHIFIINKNGALVYAGAIDSISSFDSNDIEKSENYVQKTMAALKEGSEVKVPSTKPYGCSVKYNN